MPIIGMLNIVRNLQYFSLLFLVTGLAGCSSRTSTPTLSLTRSMSAQAVNDARLQMEQIPLPSKTRYMAVKSLSSWENPYLTVQGNMLTLHVMLADANTSGLGEGGLLRPVGARRQDLNVRPSDLPTALNAIPEGSWPYGRVIAVEEAHKVPTEARPEVRRNVEKTIQILNNLDVVVYEWSEGGVGLR